MPLSALKCWDSVFQMWPLAWRCSGTSGYPGTLQNQKHSNHHLLSIESVVPQFYICMNSGWNWVVTCGGNEMKWWMRLILHYFKKVLRSLNRSASKRGNRIMIALRDTVLSLLPCALPGLEDLLTSQGQTKLQQKGLESFIESQNGLGRMGPSKIIES